MEIPTFPLTPAGVWLGLALVALTAPASGQMRVTVEDGFAPDPLAVAVTSTGTALATGHVRGCPGRAGAAPDLRPLLASTLPLLPVHAAAGDWSLWVGVHAGVGGEAARLEVGRAPAAPRDVHDPAAAPVGETQALAAAGRHTLDLTTAAAGDGSPHDVFVSPMANPFAGLDGVTAAEMLALVVDEQGLSDRLRYGHLEPIGEDGFVLHDVVLIDPDDPAAELHVARVELTELDREGLVAGRGPGSFAIVFDGIDYARLVEAQDMIGLMLQLPGLADAPALTLRASLLPPVGRPDRRELAFAIDFERQFALRLFASIDWRERDGVPPSLEEAVADSLSVEFENRGFLGHVLRAQAEEMGMEASQFGAMLLGALRRSVEPADPGSPRARLVEVFAQAVSDPDRRGIVRLELATDEPQGIGALLEEIQSPEDFDDRLKLELFYEPIP